MYLSQSYAFGWLRNYYQLRYSRQILGSWSQRNTEKDYKDQTTIDTKETSKMIL